MIKFNGQDENGRKLMGLGLSDANIRELKLGHPIRFEGDKLGFEGTVLIMWGKTEDALADIVRPYVQGEVRDHRGVQFEMPKAGNLIEVLIGLNWYPAVVKSVEGGRSKRITVVPWRDKLFDGAYSTLTRSDYEHGRLWRWPQPEAKP
jgi:hypothetical protein